MFLKGKATSSQNIILNEHESNSRKLSIGIIADIQYAPIPDGTSFSGVPRFYRHAIDVACHAAKHFEEEGVTCVLNLGDIIDGKCQEIEKYGGIEPESVDPGISAVDDVLNALSTYKKGPVIHTYGNHELYNLSRETLGQKLGIPFVTEPCGDLVGYYSRLIRAPDAKENVKNMLASPSRDIRFVVIDSYDIATMQRCPDTSQKRKKAEQYLSKNNPNYPLNKNSPEGMDGYQKRFVEFNGAVDKPQLQWLRETLQDAKNKGECVIILSHQPILPDSSSPVCLMWNYDEVLSVLREFKGVVAASFCGHAHKGGYLRDEQSGIHFRVFEAVLESQYPIKTYGFLDVFEDRLEIRGSGKLRSATYLLDHLDDKFDGEDNFYSKINIET